MKKIKIVTIGALLLLMSSCSSGLLDITNENFEGTGTFWKSEKDIEDGVISVYGMFYRQGTWTRNIHVQMNGMADDGVSYAGWTELNEYTKFIFTNYNFGEVNVKIWEEHYIAIYRANQVLDNIGKVAFRDEDHRKDLIAQVKFLRSFYYFYLTTLWDNVPLILATSSAADQPQQKSADEIMNQIETDLEAAILDLPEERSSTATARPTKGSAYALLARTYAQHHKWADAKRCLEWLIDTEGKKYYDLANNFVDNFSNNTENNKESLYEIHFSLANRVGFDQTDNAFDPNAQLGTQIEISQSPAGIGWNNIEARRWLIDWYKREKTIDGKNDPRLFYTLWYDNASSDFPEFTHKIYGSDWKSEWGSRVFIKKYSTDASPIYYWNDNNYRVLRYADMLLLYAEVINEVDGPTAKALECINRVRNRVGLSDIQDSKYYDGAAISTNKDAFRKQVKIERTLELALECIRWIDLKRWGIDAATLTEIKTRDEDFNNFVIDKTIRMPIPQSDVDNNPNLNQNYLY